MDKVIGRQYLTASGLVSHKPVYLKGIILTPDGTNSSYVDIYNGENTTAEKIMRLRVQANRSYHLVFNTSFYLNRGLYVDFGANLEAVTVLYDPAE